MHTVLVLGGYGNFGQPICRALAGDDTIRLIIAGRDAARALAFCVSLGAANASGVALDAQAKDLNRRLVELNVDTVIHTAGPFQGQGYDVAAACISAGCNYIDLADARDFVCGIGALDQAARANGVLLVSGASSVPALAGAAVDALLPDFSTLHEIRQGISSSAKTPGLATMQAVFGYCGKPFHRLEDGAERTTYGWQDLKLHDYPAPVGRRLLASCDVPDLDLFPRRYPGVRTVTFHAGVGNPIAHLATWLLSSFVRKGWMKSLLPWAPTLRRLNQLLEPFGSDNSAMHVELRGLDQQGAPLTRRWCLVASNNHGPQIPCGAAIALARKLASGQLRLEGAMPCVGLLKLDEYLAALVGLSLKQVWR